MWGTLGEVSDLVLGYEPTEHRFLYEASICELRRSSIG
jgi:hypothetical protein